MSGKKIFYVGQLGDGTTSLDRLNAIKSNGFEVEGFNVSLYQPKNRLLRSLMWRFQPTYLLTTLNQDIVNAAISGKYNCAWIDKGVWIFPETIEKLKKHCGFVLHFTPDPQLLFHRSKHFIQAIPTFDCIVTTKSFEVDLYHRLDAKEVILSQQSYCPRRYANLASDSKYHAQIGFIGHYEEHYAKTVMALTDFPGLKIWGNGWSHGGKFSSRNLMLASFVQGSGVWGRQYPVALKSFDIGLGLLSKIIPEQHTTRSFEIPAAGTFLLAERTVEHLKFFDEGLEAEFFDCPEELRNKADYYLKNIEARKKIALAGFNRCIKSGYDTDNVIKNILNKISI